MKHYVPRQPFLDLIQEYINENNITSTIMSRQFGFSDSYIQSTVDDKAIKMEFNTADMLLCKMRKVYLWWEPPYEQWYWNGEIPPDKSKPVKCGNPRCGEWFSLQLHGGKAKYCSNPCKTMAGRINRKQAPATDDEAITLKCLYCLKEYKTIRISGGAAQTARRKTCGSKECKKMNKAENQRKYWARKKEEDASKT